LTYLCFVSTMNDCMACQHLWALWLLQLDTYVYCISVWLTIKKTCFLLFELFDFAADEPPQRGVCTPIFLVPNVPEKFGTIQNVLHHSELIQIVLHHSVLRTIENVSKSQNDWNILTAPISTDDLWPWARPMRKNQQIKKKITFYICELYSCMQEWTCVLWTDRMQSKSASALLRQVVF